MPKLVRIEMLFIITIFIMGGQQTEQIIDKFLFLQAKIISIIFQYLY